MRQHHEESSLRLNSQLDMSWLEDAWWKTDTGAVHSRNG